jgi:GT2 family glycosyltransferase
MPSGDPLLSIVILSWNRKADLFTTLQAVSRQGYTGGETIVVDNGSTDGSPEMVRALYPDVRLVTLPQNVGIEGLNVGMREARGEIVVLLDDDSYPVEGTLARLVVAFQRDPHMGIAAGRIVGSADAVERERSVRLESEPGRDVPTFVGCGVGLRRAALEQAGLFDSAFFLYGNELDLAARVMDAGYAVRYLPGAVFVHAVSSTNRTSLRAEYYGTRNLLWIIWKYFPLQEAVPLSLRVPALSVGYRLSRGDLRRVWGVLRGVGGALVGRRRPLDRRVVSRETRRQLLTYIDEWYPPPRAWLRGRLRGSAQGPNYGQH